MRAIVVTRSVDLAAPRSSVWPLVAETDRFNRWMGMREVTFRPIEVGARSGARYVGETRAAGFKLVYEEFPFEWSLERSFGVHRRMRGGPVESYTWRCTLEAAPATERAPDGGTRATVRFEITPRAWVLGPVAWINARRFVSEFARLCARIEAHVAAGAPSPYVEPVSPADAARVAAAVGRLREAGVDSTLAARLGDRVRDGPDADVARMRPFEVADEWGLPRREVLRAFLRGVPAGLVEMRWGLLCPSCLTASEQAKALDEVPPEGHCQLCDITFDLDLDRAVEATFRPHKAFRDVPEGTFCIGGPSRTPHVLLQASVDPGDTRELEAPAGAGRYRLFARGGSTASVEVEASAPSNVEVDLDDQGLRPHALRVSPGGRVQIRSRCSDTRHVKIERLAFASSAATAHEVSTMDEFRTLFSSDLLKRGTPLKVARAALLFSDLTASTALYARVGDAAAFRLVDDHFDLLREVVRRHDGAVVKTMGDAVMAAFVDSRTCALAALDPLARFEIFCAQAKHGEHVGLKLGMYAGPCYVVTANGALDYFGQTVNVASRLQHLARSGEIVMPVDVFESLQDASGGGDAPLAPGERPAAAREKFETMVKGVDHPLRLVRVALAPVTAPRSIPAGAVAPSPRP
ncbi:MAG TPA: adenylate/guanylate cyclase domain-containing protein [Polyangiaceae bacterium]|nr:adenylate/guanylate cyclase domain-containing protein [Polyangiaceae bacterium]